MCSLYNAFLVNAQPHNPVILLFVCFFLQSFSLKSFKVTYKVGKTGQAGLEAAFQVLMPGDSQGRRKVWKSGCASSN